MTQITATVEQFRSISGLGRSTIYELIKSGDIRSVRVLGRRLIIVDSYREFLARLETADA